MLNYEGVGKGKKRTVCAIVIICKYDGLVIWFIYRGVHAIFTTGTNTKIYFVKIVCVDLIIYDKMSFNVHFLFIVLW